jgi:thymidylate synthase
VFSCLGEALWYLAGDDSVEFITHYLSRYGENSDDHKKIWGAYGPRIFGRGAYTRQILNVIGDLRERPQTRQAVIQIFDAHDISVEHNDVPCTCVMQFAARGGRLHMIVYMRSNDAFVGLPHDVFAFTMIQELVARSLGLKLGVYDHFIGSLHLYDEHRDRAKNFLKEGFQNFVPMPAMPVGDPWQQVTKVLNAERTIRLGGQVDIGASGFTPYWADIVRLLEVFAARGRPRIIGPLKQQMFSPIFDAYIEKAVRMKPRVTS